MSRGSRESRFAGLALALLALGACAVLLWRTPAAQTEAEREHLPVLKPAWDVAALRANVPGLLVVRNGAKGSSELRVVRLSNPATETVLWTAPANSSPRLLAVDPLRARIAVLLTGPPQELVVLSADGSLRRSIVPSNRTVTTGAFDGADMLLATNSFVEPRVQPGTPLRLTLEGVIVPASVTGAPRRIPLSKVFSTRDGYVVGVFSPVDFGSPVLARLERSAEGWRVKGATYTGQADEEPWDDLPSAVGGPGTPAEVAFLQRHVAGNRVWFDVARLSLGAPDGARTFARGVGSETTTGPQAVVRNLARPRLGTGPVGSVLAAIEESRSPHFSPEITGSIASAVQDITLRLVSVSATGRIAPLEVRVTETGPFRIGRVPYSLTESWLWVDRFGASGPTGGYRPDPTAP